MNPGSTSLLGHVPAVPTAVRHAGAATPRLDELGDRVGLREGAVLVVDGVVEPGQREGDVAALAAPLRLPPRVHHRHVEDRPAVVVVAGRRAQGGDVALADRLDLGVPRTTEDDLVRTHVGRERVRRVGVAVGHRDPVVRTVPRTVVVAVQLELGDRLGLDGTGRLLVVDHATAALLGRRGLADHDGRRGVGLGGVDGGRGRTDASEARGGQDGHQRMAGEGTDGTGDAHWRTPCSLGLIVTCALESLNYSKVYIL